MITKLKFKDHEEWLGIRSRYIGGSDAAAVVGMNPYKSAYALWAEKTGKIAAFDGNLTTEVGAFLEEMVAQLFTRETGKSVQKRNATFVNSDYPFACANIDRAVVGEKALLECKTTNSIPYMRKCRGGDFPDAWYCQMTHYLAVTGLERAYLGVLVNCREFYVYTLERDEDEIAALMGAEKTFWEDNVLKDCAPAPDGEASTGDAISEMYQDDGGEDADLTAYLCELEEYGELGRQIKALKSRQDTVSNTIKDFMGASPRGAADGYKVTWTCSERSSFDGKKYMDDHPDTDFSDYIKSTKIRTFRVTERKN